MSDSITNTNTISNISSTESIESSFDLVDQTKLYNSANWNWNTTNVDNITVNDITIKIKDDLMSFKDYDITNFGKDLPKSKLEKISAIDLNNVIVPVNLNECDELARDVNGNKIPLNDDQLKSVRDHGILCVDSKLSPDLWRPAKAELKHVWQLNWILQKGKQPTKETFLNEISMFCDQIFVQIPARVMNIDKSLSIGNGIFNICKTVDHILNLFIGMPRSIYKNSNNTVQSRLHTYCKNEIIKSIMGKNITNIDGTVSGSGSSLYVLVDRIRSMITKLNDPIKEFIKNWTFDTLKRRNKLSDSLSYDSKHKSQEIATNILNLERELYKKEIFKIIKNTLDKNDALILIRVIKTVLLYDSYVKKYNEDKQKAIVDYKNQLKDEHNIMTRRPHYVKTHVAEFIIEYEAKYPLEEIINRDISKKLSGQEKVIFNKYHEILNSQEYADYKRSLEKKMIPQQNFQWKFKIWLPRNWKINKMSNDMFEVQKYSLINSSTKYPFWRFYNFLLRTLKYFCNGNYNLFMNFLYGPIGLMSLVGTKEFASQYDIDRKTGKLIVTGTTHTLWSRIAALWQNVKESREEFEKSKDTGILGKSITRVFNIIWNYGIKGLFGTALCVIGHPILTVCNSIISLASIITSPVWAPVLSLLKYLFDMFIYDESFPFDKLNWLKLFKVVIWNFLTKGLGQILFSGLGIMAHGIWGVMILLWAFCSNGIRAIYDALIYHLILKHLAKIPSEDGFLVKRIKGPGLSEQYHYVINYDLALIMLQFELEKMEFDAYYKNKTHEIDQPYDELLKYYKQYNTCGLSPNYSVDPLKKFSETKKNVYNKLNKLSDEHWKNHKMSNSLNERDKIKLNKNDLYALYDQGSQLCESFITNKVLSRLTQGECLTFWKDKNVAPGDWKNIVIYCLKRSFNDSITIPIEDTDGNGFAIEVKKINTKNFIRKLLHANLGDSIEIESIDYSKNSVHDIEKFDTDYINFDRILNDNFISKISVSDHDIDKYKDDHFIVNPIENPIENHIENPVEILIVGHEEKEENEMIKRQKIKQEQLKEKVSDYKTFNS